MRKVTSSMKRQARRGARKKRAHYPHPATAIPLHSPRPKIPANDTPPPYRRSASTPRPPPAPSATCPTS